MGFLCVSGGNTQEKIGFEFAGHVGKLLDISSEFPEVGLNYQFDFAIVLATKRPKYWHSVYNYPEVQIRTAYANYGNNAILGSSFSVLPELHHNTPIGTSYCMDWHVGYGLTFFNKPYDAIRNPLNLVVGSSIMATPSVGIGFGKKINNCTYSILLNYRHSSNGHFSVPNIGTNVPLIGFAVKYSPLVRDILSQDILDTIDVNKQIRFALGGGYGIHEIEGTLFPSGGPKYNVVYGRLEVAYRLNHKSSLHSGLSCSFSEAARYFILNESMFNGKVKGNNLKVVGYVGHEFHFSHLGIYLDLGMNLYDPFRKELVRNKFIVSNFFDTHFSNEFGFNYYLLDPINKAKLNGAFNLSLRTIWGKADFFNAGFKLLL